MVGVVRGGRRRREVRWAVRRRRRVSRRERMVVWSIIRGVEVEVEVAIVGVGVGGCRGGKGSLWW